MEYASQCPNVFEGSEKKVLYHGPVCWKCKGTGLLRVKQKRKQDKREKKKPRIEAENQQTATAESLCKVCGGRGRLGMGGTIEQRDTNRLMPVIGVVGGGIGGAAVALALLRRGFRVRVYERDNSFAERQQGKPTLPQDPLKVPHL